MEPLTSTLSMIHQLQGLASTEPTSIPLSRKTIHGMLYHSLLPHAILPLRRLPLLNAYT